MDKELRILILEDVPADAELEEHELRKAGLVFTSKVVDTREAFLKELNEFLPDLILSDYELPSFDGLAALRIAKEKCPDVPFILVSGNVGEEFAIEKLKEGATDYVLKGNLKRLVPSVKRALEEAMLITERKQAEEALKNETLRRSILMDRSLDGIAILNQEHELVEVNQRFAEMLGYTPKELIGLHPWDWQAVMTEEEIRSNFVDLTKINVVFETRHRRKDGTIFDVEVSASGTKVGDKPMVFSIYRDITERKQAEAKLMSSEKRLRDLNVLQGLMLHPNSNELKLKLVTEAVVRVVGADFARIWMIKPGDRCEAGCIHAQVAEGPHSCRFRNRCLHMMASSGRYTHTDGKEHSRVPFGCYKIGKIAAGEESKFLTNKVTTDPRVHNHTWAKELGLVSFAGYRLADSNGIPLGVLALFSKQAISAEEDLLLQGIADATSQVLKAGWAEKALKESEERFKDLFENANDLIQIVDAEGKFLYVNRKWRELLGFTDNEARQKKFADIVRKKELSYCTGIFKRVANGESIERIETVFVSKDGRELYVEGSLNPSFKDRNFVSCRGIFRDITERKKAEELEHKRTEQIILNKKALLELTAMQTSDLDTFSKIITLMSSQVLGVERVSLWFFDSLHSGIICEALYLLSKNIHEKGFRLRAEDYPKYFEALEEDRVLAADDARTDPRTSEFTGHYLNPLGIFSMMDIPLRRHGKVIGVMCYEDITPRQWTQEDQNFAATVGHIIISALEDFERKKAAAALKKSEKELKKRVKELEEFYDIAIGRELRMKDLKEEIEGLNKELEKYKKQ